MERFHPVPEESPALVPPSRRPPTAVGIATMPPDVPPEGIPWQAPTRLRFWLGVTGVGLIGVGLALSQVSLLLIPISALVCWFGIDGLLAGLIGHRSRGLVRLG